MMPNMTSEPNDQEQRLNGRGGASARVSGMGVTGGPGSHRGPADGGASRRRSGRLPAECLKCNLGLVIDISVGGMCVLSRTPHSGTLKITFPEYRMPGKLLATVTWSKRAGVFMREMGLRFENVTPEMSALLTQIASTHRFRRAI